MGICCSGQAHNVKVKPPSTQPFEVPVVPEIKILPRSKSPENNASPHSEAISRPRSPSEFKRAQTLNAQRMRPPLSHLPSLFSRTHTGMSATLQYSQSDLPHVSSTSFFDLVTPLQSVFRTDSCKDPPLFKDTFQEAEAPLITHEFKKTYRQDGVVQINQYVLQLLIASVGPTEVYYATAGVNDYLVTINRETHPSSQERLLQVKHPNVLPLVEVIAPHGNNKIIGVQLCYDCLNVPVHKNLRKVLVEQLIDAYEYLEEQGMQVITASPMLFLDRSGTLRVPWTIKEETKASGEAEYQCAKMGCYLALGATTQEANKILATKLAHCKGRSFASLRRCDWVTY